MNNQESYIYGLLLADGNIYLSHAKERRIDNRGRVTLEVNEKDKDIVVKLFSIIPNSKISQRTRDTNYKKNYSTFTFYNGQREFREWLFDNGFPKQNKTFLAAPPIKKYSEIDFWRGFLDGDGSLGITANNIPFVSLVTDSENIKTAYLDFLARTYDIHKKSSRNKRDNAYNIMITNEKAVRFAKDLYLSSDIYLDRKYQKAIILQQWVRTAPKRKAS